MSLCDAKNEVSCLIRDRDKTRKICNSRSSQCSPYSILNRFFSTYLFSWYVYLNFNFCFLHNLRSLSSISPFVFLNYLLPCSMIYPELPVSGVSSDSFPNLFSFCFHLTSSPSLLLQFDRLEVL